jgi:hypothetical protein
VVFPLTAAPLAVGQPLSVRLVDDVMRGNRLIALAAQRAETAESPGPDDLHRVGTAALVHQLARLPDGSMRVIVQGIERVRLLDFVSIDSLVEEVRRATLGGSCCRNGSVSPKRRKTCAIHTVASTGSRGGYGGAVGERGRVFAVDIDERAVNELKRRVAEAPFGQVEVVLGAPDDPKLRSASLDAALIVNSYHRWRNTRTCLCTCGEHSSPGEGSCLSSPSPLRAGARRGRAK